MTYQEQIDYIDTTINNDPSFMLISTTWHMATKNEMKTLFDTYDAYDIYQVFTFTDNTEPAWYEFEGRYDDKVLNLPSHYRGMFRFNHLHEVSEEYFDYDYVNDSLSDFTLGAWVTASAVPIPSAIWLLGSGLTGIVGIRKKFKK